MKTIIALGAVIALLGTASCLWPIDEGRGRGEHDRGARSNSGERHGDGGDRGERSDRGDHDRDRR